MSNFLNSRGFKIFSRIIIFLLFVILISASTYFYIKYQNAVSGTSSDSEVEMLVQEISKSMLLPDEEPTIATVTEKDKLSGQSFFELSENGDKVLIFLKTGKAILYRPSSKKIIDVTKITQNIDQQNGIEQAGNPGASQPPLQFAPDPTPVPTFTPTPTPIPTPSPTPIDNTPVEKQFTVTILNGTTITGLAKVVENSLIDNYKEYSVVSRGNAVRNDYAKTVVIDVLGANSAKAQELATLVSGKVISIPDGEILPQTDFLVIAGSDLSQ